MPTLRKYTPWQYDFVVANYEKMPIAEIMKKANVPKSYIGNVRHKLGLKKKELLTEQQINFIEYWYNQGLNPHQVSIKLKIPPSKVYYQLTKMNLITPKPRKK